MTLRDPNHLNTFCVAFRIFVVGDRRDFKFGIQVDRRVQPYGRQIVSEKGVVCHVTLLKFLGLIHVSGMAEELSNFVHRDIISSLQKGAWLGSCDRFLHAQG